MSIATKTGDKGSTSLLYGRRVPKYNLRVDAYGTVDELCACLGLIRAALTDEDLKKQIYKIQQDTFTINAELATTLYDSYKLSGKKISQTHLDFLDKEVKNIEGNFDVLKDWHIPGESWNSALLDLGRTVCRRAERACVILEQEQLLDNKLILQYLNRLSDLLWLIARKVDLEK